MIFFVLGTTAELVKVKPIINELRKRNATFRIWCTGQQYTELKNDEYFKSLDGSNSHVEWIARGVRGSSLTKISQAPIWLLKCLGWFVLHYFSNFRTSRRRSLFIVHGDTMTTVLGALFGKLLFCDVAHVEAGLRSHDWRNPFPEELDRIVTSWLTNIHFAPSEESVQNLKGKRGVVVYTHGNTVVDQVRAELTGSALNPSTDQILVLLHRTELLTDANLLDDTLGSLLRISDSQKILIVADALSRAAFENQPNFKLLQSSQNIRISPKLSHSLFLQELANSKLVVTDSGGLQEECASLGIPCIVHRRTSERSDGLEEGGTAQLTGLAVEKLTELIQNPPLKKPPKVLATSPTQVIVAYLSTSGYLDPV